MTPQPGNREIQRNQPGRPASAWAEARPLPAPGTCRERGRAPRGLAVRCSLKAAPGKSAAVTGPTHARGKTVSQFRRFRASASWSSTHGARVRATCQARRPGTRLRGDSSSGSGGAGGRALAIGPGRWLTDPAGGSRPSPLILVHLSSAWRKKPGPMPHPTLENKFPGVHDYTL